jgi:hypothetical protein
VNLHALRRRRWGTGPAALAIAAIMLQSGCGHEAMSKAAAAEPTPAVTTCAGTPTASAGPPTANARTATASAGHRGGARTDFRMFDNTSYTNVDLSSSGAIKSNIVYEGDIARLSGQTSDYIKHHTPGVELELPPREAYEALVRRYGTNPGPVVLDIESLYLTGAPNVAQRHFDKLAQMLAWAHGALPCKAIGVYGLLGNVAPEYVPLAQRLAVQQDAFFPSLYLVNEDPAAWRARLAERLAEAAAIDPIKPVYPYIWPEYHSGSALAGQYVPTEFWRFQLTESRSLVDGVVIWSMRVPNTDPRWVAVTKQFMTATQ